LPVNDFTDVSQQISQSNQLFLLKLAIRPLHTSDHGKGDRRRYRKSCDKPTHCQRPHVPTLVKSNKPVTQPAAQRYVELKDTSIMFACTGKQMEQVHVIAKWTNGQMLRAHVTSKELALLHVRGDE
jgi:hypothetical protein